MPESTLRLSEGFARWIVGGMSAAIVALASWGWQQHSEAAQLRLEKALVEIELRNIDRALGDMAKGGAS